MAAANTQSDAIRKALQRAGQQLGRLQGPELFISQTFDPGAAATTTITPSRPLPLTRPMESLIIEVKGRVAVTVAPYTAVAPEAPQNILQNITLQGNHQVFGSFTPINMSGASAFMWPWLFGQQGGQVYINGVLAGAPGDPLTSPFLGTTAGSPYDIRILYHIPLGPCLGFGEAAKKQQTQFLYQGKGGWQDSLQLQLVMGDKSAFGDPTGATVTFSGFGGSGSLWTVNVYQVFALNGDFRNMPTGAIVRTENMLTAFTAAASAGTQLQLLQHQITTNVAVRTGAIQTAGLSGGVVTLASVSDTILDSTQLQVDNKPIRNNTNNMAFKSFVARQFGLPQPQGWINFTFLDGQSALLAYRGDQLDGGSQFQLTSSVTAGANNRLFVIQEQVRGGPYSS